MEYPLSRHIERGRSEFFGEASTSTYLYLYRYLYITMYMCVSERGPLNKKEDDEIKPEERANLF